jgi:hypothetical protein
MGTMCTRNQRRARTKSSPEQKVKGKAGARGRPASDLADVTFTGSYRSDRTGRVRAIAPLEDILPGRFSVLLLRQRPLCAWQPARRTACRADRLPRSVWACVGKRWYQSGAGRTRILAFVRLRPRSDLMASPCPCCAFANVRSQKAWLEATEAWQAIRAITRPPASM